MEVDPETWPMIEGLISHVWVSESVPFPEAEESLATPPAGQSTRSTLAIPSIVRRIFRRPGIVQRIFKRGRSSLDQ